MRDSLEARSDISFENPLRPVFLTEGYEAGFHRIRCRAATPKSVSVRISRGFRDGIKGQQVQGLHSPISHGRDREGTPPAVWSANGLLHPPPIQNRACELLRTR